MESEKNSVEESRAESWMRRFSEWEESGLSQREFCRTRGISLSGFRYWRSRLAEGPGTSSANVVRVAEVSSGAISSRATVRIHVGGNVVEADAGIDPDRLKAILVAVRGI
jgi:hypothetical protein